MNNEIRYNYVDENNNVLFTKVRVNNPKSFYSEREINGQFITNLEDTRKVLYQLPQVLEAIQNNKPIFLCEGEKDVETLMKNGLVATTTHSTSYWSPEFTTILKDADIVILFDYDKAGFDRKEKLIKKIIGNVKQLRCLDLPGLEYTEKHGKDVTDWLEMGHTVAELVDLVENTPYYKTLTISDKNAAQAGPLKVIGLKDFVNLEIPNREMLLSPIIPAQGLIMIAAKRGVGKTHIALGMAYAMATGDTFLRWNAPTPKKVLYIDGEMPATSMQERLKKIILMSNESYNCDYEFFHLLTPDQQDRPMPDLSTQEGRDAIEPFIDDSDCIFLDNISCLFRSGGENDSECWQEAQSWALDLRRRGKAVVFVHHAGKSGSQRGTSKKEDILDTVITLKHPDDYKAEQGACFEIEFSKARHFFGNDANSFIVQLIEDDHEQWRWEERESSENMLIEKIAELRNTGFTIKAVETETKLTKSQVETFIQKAKKRGLL